MKRKNLIIANNNFSIETDRIAKQANGAVLVKQNDTVVLVTVTAAQTKKEGLDFFPLTVEYRERTAAGGFIPGGYTKRELRPSDNEILTSRIIDRSIRPLFPKEFKYETQVMATVLSYDESVDPALLSILGASSALLLSDIPWNGPVLAVRICLINDSFIPFPTQSDLAKARLNIVSSIGKDGLVMVEGSGRECSEDELLKALTISQKEVIQPLEELSEWCSKNGKEKRSIEILEANETLFANYHEEVNDKLKKLFGKKFSKMERKAKFDEIVRSLTDKINDTSEDITKEIKDFVEKKNAQLVRKLTIEQKKRLDGRAYDEIRPIWGEINWLPRTHGSAIFTRGETQALVSCTLGSNYDEQIVETLHGQQRHNFILHYNFPSYSVGETRAIRGPGRREIGHGTLAKRALEAVLPSKSNFPYTIRVVSDIAESNGSSSMATVCGGCLALLDAGVPLATPVAGIAMGLIKEKEEIAILSDILGDEDHLGDMDFKVTGTDKGITAVQMDNKLGSLESSILEKALEQARLGRMFILNKMLEISADVTNELSALAPRIETLKIRQNKIGALIGPGGKVIQNIQSETNTKIEISDNGTVKIFGQDKKTVEIALDKVNYITAEPEVGKIYSGTVTTIKPFGIFVKIFADIEGLVHKSEIGLQKNQELENVFHVGEEIQVKVIGVDNRGRIKLSRKEVL